MYIKVDNFRTQSRLRLLKRSKSAPNNVYRTTDNGGYECLDTARAKSSSYRRSERVTSAVSSVSGTRTTSEALTSETHVPYKSDERLLSSYGASSADLIHSRLRSCDLRTRSCDSRTRSSVYVTKEPRHGTYDIRYTSTSLIILNNSKKRNKLRQYQEESSEKNKRLQIDPDRHFRGQGFYTSNRSHDHCFVSVGPRFEPTIVPEIYFNRPESSLIGDYLHEARYSVNQHRHRSCRPKSEVLPRGTPRMTPTSTRTFTSMSATSRGHVV